MDPSFAAWLHTKKAPSPQKTGPSITLQRKEPACKKRLCPGVDPYQPAKLPQPASFQGVGGMEEGGGPSLPGPKALCFKDEPKMGSVRNTPHCSPETLPREASAG